MSRDIPAFEIRDGRAVPCVNYGPKRRRCVNAPPPLAFRGPTLLGAIAAAVVAGLFWPLLSEKERILSRYASPSWEPASTVETDTGHLLRDSWTRRDGTRGHTDILLYLPECAQLTDAHIQAVTEAWRK